MTDLAARIEAGPGSRELSDAVLRCLGWRRSGFANEQGVVARWWCPGNIPDGQQHDPTRSERDAFALLPSDVDFVDMEMWHGGNPCAPLVKITLYVVRRERNHLGIEADISNEYHGEAPTPALAVSAALVRAANPT